jgi:hypothetical protein
MLSGAESTLVATSALLLAAALESTLAARKSAAERKPEAAIKEATLTYVALEEDGDGNDRGSVWVPDENASPRHFILMALAYAVAVAEAIDWLALGDDAGYLGGLRALAYLLLGAGAELDYGPLNRNGAVNGRAAARALAALLACLERLAPWYGLGSRIWHTSRAK